MDYTITVGEKKITAPEGSNLLQVLRQAGMAPDAPCGGNGSCGKCLVLVDGKKKRSCHTQIHRDMTVEIPGQGASVILADRKEPVRADGKQSFAFAFDVGTTTLVCYLLDGVTGKVLASAGDLNPQGKYGADVISRIQYAMENGAQTLRQETANALEDLAWQTLKVVGVPVGQVGAACLVGNTAMHHLLLGYDPKPLTVPPYMPSVKQALRLDRLGVDVRVLPNIAGFVGADTVGCMVSCGFDRLDKITLLIDIGTNGEMVLADGNFRLACSTAAGPAFEGAKISCGMRGQVGAVDHVWIEDDTLCWSVIGGGVAKGLCGSGLLDLTACLLELGEISESGRMEREEFTLPGTQVSLTRKDVREVQLAKGAIRAGIELMCQYRGIKPEDIRQVLLAGAFGNYMDPVSACAIGMIPPVLKDRVCPMGNAAGSGAAMCAVNEEDFHRAIRLAEGTEFLELASMKQFQDMFVDCLLFEEED